MAEPFNDGVVDELSDDGKPIIHVWHKEGRVNFGIQNASINEMEDGTLVPGLAVSPHSAVEIAHAILDRALKAMEDEQQEEV